MFLRLEVGVRPEFSDPEGDGILKKAELAMPEIRRNIRWGRYLPVYWLDVDLPRETLIHAITEVFLDRVSGWLFTGNLIPSACGKYGTLQDIMEHSPHRPGSFWALERRYRSGVTDPVARTVIEAISTVLGRDLTNARAASGGLLILEGPKLDQPQLETLAKEVYCNELIESWTLFQQEEIQLNSRFHSERVRRELPVTHQRSDRGVETFDFEKMPDSELLSMSQERLWALSLPELKAIQRQAQNPEWQAARQGLNLPIGKLTDVEIEIFAQTWSEHCKHKIFGAEISYREDLPADPLGQHPVASHGHLEIPATVNGLFRETIVQTTEAIPRKWLLSVFSDNAGIVAWDDDDALCLKVETHNSPSALDPYGGALTGIVGVNRDILGTGVGARPLFNTDVFCVAPIERTQSLPDRVLHPRRILEGVRKGVEDGGNQSGIPTVNGALVFDERYLGKPLVFCGTGGILPRRVMGQAGESKTIQPGDAVVMVGGRIGKDGIHGATFSSIALDEMAPSSAVQLGDPITQKRMTDFLMVARDRGLYRTLTDNGAGGLASSVGELAQLSGGAKIDVAKAKTKYPGLKPFELAVSESQERMTCAVAPETLREFELLAEQRGVDVSVLGEFNTSGAFEIYFENNCVAHLPLDFLHHGVPRMHLDAVWNGPKKGPSVVELGFEKEAPRKLVELLSRPNIASKEWLIRQFDHEVQGTSVIKPLHTAQPGSKMEWSGPNDGAVLKPKSNSWMGVAVGCGILPKLSDIDAGLMAQAAVDEAIRNVLAVGVEYGRPENVLALVDNFCWPDPTVSTAFAADLVRACYGMREACLRLRIPLISGKDSMKNDFKGKRDGKPIQISAVPTLLMTAMGRVPDVRMARTSDFKAVGDWIYLLGPGRFGLQGSELHHHYVEKLRERGGNEAQVVLPMSHAEAPFAKVGTPDWESAILLYTWLGYSEGKRQHQLRSVHDVSEGGLFTAIAESMLARNLGARIEIPDRLAGGETVDLWEFGFGEGFHSFVISCPEGEASYLEQEWREIGVPYLRLGTVTASSELVVQWRTPQFGQWSVGVSQLRSAWSREGVKE